MKFFKFLILAGAILTLIGGVSAQTRQRKSSSSAKAKSKTAKKAVAPKIVTEIKIIAEGTYSSVETPRLIIARSAKEYAELQTLIENLPSASEIDFKKTAVVAAFAGLKNTGGYSVAVRRAKDKIKIEVVAPPKDAITTDSLTQPFAVALVAVEEISRLEFSAEWKNERFSDA